MPALLILISVGLLIGTWMIGGTIPLMIYYGLKNDQPRNALCYGIIGDIISVGLYRNFMGSAGTIGVAFMGVAVGMDETLLQQPVP